MARKADDLLSELDQLGNVGQPSAAPSTTGKSTLKAPATKAAKSSHEEDENLFGDIEKQLAAKPPQPSSRPVTPRISSSTTSGTKSPKRAEHTPASSGRNSEEKVHNTSSAQPASGETSRGYYQNSTSTETLTSKVESKEESASSGGGGWWGMVSGAASAARKQAEALAKEIQKHDEAQKWADQVRGYGAGIQNFGTDLRSRALPTFTSLISHIAPPISAHERLQIHITHDIVHYPSLDPLIYSTFSRVMAQVEGGDLLILQRGSESRSRGSSDLQGYRGGMLGSGSGWTDGPWWRDEAVKRDLGSVQGLKEGTRLARVSAESYAKEFFDARGGIEEVAKKASETLSESNPVRSSDIFLAIQALAYPADSALFADAAQVQSDSGVVDPETSPEDLISFAIYLHDPLHSLSFATLTQPFPQKWASWLDAQVSSDEADALPDSIREIIDSGGVDPREWVAEWMEEVLALGVGVVAQRYVARRMGVGEGGLGRGKRRAEEEGVGGEAARAI